MSDTGRVDPNYRGMLEAKQQQFADPKQAVNDSQAEEMEMEPGAHWTMEAAKGVYTSGGNEGDWDPSYHPDDPELGPDPV